MKDKKKELLTKELFMQIQSDKTNEILSIKDERQNVLEYLTALRTELIEATEEKSNIESKIRNLRVLISNSEEKEYVLSRDLKYQSKLSSKLNKQITKENSYIVVDEFYPENKEPKKR